MAVARQRRGGGARLGGHQSCQEMLDLVVGIWRFIAQLAVDGDPFVADAAFASIGALFAARCCSRMNGRLLRRLPRIESWLEAYDRLRQRVCGYFMLQVYHLFTRAVTLSSSHSSHKCGINATRAVSAFLAYLGTRHDTINVDSPASAPFAGTVNVAVVSLVMQWVSVGLLPLLAPTDLRRSDLVATAAGGVLLLTMPLRPHYSASGAMSSAAGAIIELIRGARDRCARCEHVICGPAYENNISWRGHGVSTASYYEAVCRSLLQPIVDAASTIISIPQTPGCAGVATMTLLPTFGTVISTLDSPLLRAEYFHGITRAFVRAVTQPRIGDLERGCWTVRRMDRENVLFDASDALETFLGTGALVSALARGAQKQAGAVSLILGSVQRRDARSACYAAFDPDSNVSRGPVLIPILMCDAII